jgi:outer membrane lipoprotein-sorting protein
MKRKFIFSLMAVAVAFFAQAQTVDEILDKYFENTGGKAKWEALQGIKYTGKLKVQTMELPMAMIELKDGRQSTSASVQGMEFRQEVYDGSTLWGTNQMTMKAEKSDAETTENFKLELGNDFPSPFLNYKKKGYKVELLGKETVDGAETFKMKLTKKPIKVDGKESENVEFYFFDTENYVPLITESEVKSGPGKGMVGQNKMSDYQDASGLLFPFTITQGAKGQAGESTIVITAIELNPKVDAAAFAFPVEKPAEKK